MILTIPWPFRALQRPKEIEAADHRDQVQQSFRALARGRAQLEHAIAID